MEATPIVKKPVPDWLLVNRKLIHDSRWLSEPFSRGQAWVDMVGLAQYKDGFIIPLNFKELSDKISGGI